MLSTREEKSSLLSNRLDPTRIPTKGLNVFVYFFYRSVTAKVRVEEVMDLAFDDVLFIPYRHYFCRIITDRVLKTDLTTDRAIFKQL